jgi:cytochrome c-type biogenesis protein CcmF
MVIGISASAWSVESLGTLRPGERGLQAGPYAVRLDAIVPRAEANYREEVARLTVFRGDREMGPVETMKRIYVTRGTPTTEAGIMSVGLSQVYASFGDAQPNGAIGLRLFYKPLILLIWIGPMIMALGGALSLTDRRFRIGAPARARGGALPAAAE